MLKIVDVSKEGDDLDHIRSLFREYEKELNEDLCFQSFEAELANPLKKYGIPTGALLLAWWDDELAGCIAMAAGPGVLTCEMKRLYVQPAYRNYGIGRALADKLLNIAIESNYRFMKLDTFIRLEQAVKLYESLGFTPISAYYVNPLPGVLYMEKSLR